jgi:hypothetical protein
MASSGLLESKRAKASRVDDPPANLAEPALPMGETKRTRVLNYDDALILTADNHLDTTMLYLHTAAGQGGAIHRGINRNVQPAIFNRI